MVSMADTELINQLLDDMYEVRPAVLAALPEDEHLRATTRRMIDSLERIRSSTAVPHATFALVSQLLARLIDVEHGALLRPDEQGMIAMEARESLEAHVEQRQALLAQAQDVEPTREVIDSSCEMIGSKITRDVSLPQRVNHLQQLLQKYLHGNAAVRRELNQIIEALTPSLNAISDLLVEAGEESPELKQARQLLEQELPDDPEQARMLLKQARKGILKAGNRMSSASSKLQHTMQEQVEKLSTLSRQLERAESEARNDPLTGLANRRSLTEYLKSLGHTGYSLLLVDIDHFKAINDEYGHDIGDEVLTLFAQMLVSCVRSSDFVARIGGEEFSITLPDTPAEESRRIADILRHSIELHPFKTSVGEINVTASFGLSEHTPGTAHITTFKAADSALYRSKRDGRNRVTLQQPATAAEALLA